VRIAIPHSIGKDEARRRVRERSGEIANFVPGFASVSTAWASDDKMNLTVGGVAPCGQHSGAQSGEGLL
jgi:hypothetical protein